MEKDSKMYEYNCLMVYLNIPNWHEFLESLNIKELDLYNPENERYGKETEPHCTILYGIHSDISDDTVMELFDNLKEEDFDLKVNGIDCFYNNDYDVLKMNIASDKLSGLNSLAKSLPHTSQYQYYKPHITLAYLQKGKGIQYIDENFRTNIDSDSIKKLVYSKTNGEKMDISIN